MSCRTHGKYDRVCRHQALSPAVTILYTRRCHAPPLRRQPHHRAQLQAAAGMLGLLQQSLGKQLRVHLQGGAGTEGRWGGTQNVLRCCGEAAGLRLAPCRVVWGAGGASARRDWSAKQ